jgi:hypothetical protein
MEKYEIGGAAAVGICSRRDNHGSVGRVFDKIVIELRTELKIFLLGQPRLGERDREQLREVYRGWR